MSDIKIYGGAAVPAAMYSKGDFVLNSGVNTTKAGVHEFRDIPGGANLYSYGTLFAMDQQSYGQFLETSAGDYSKAMYRVHHGWDRYYGSHTTFGLGKTLTIEHDRDPLHRRMARAYYTVPPSLTLTSPSITVDANAMFNSYTGVLELLPSPHVQVIHNIQLPIEHAEYIHLMSANKGYLCKANYYNDEFIVTVSNRLYWFKKVSNVWTFMQAVNSPVGLGYMCAMNQEYYVNISGSTVHIFKKTNDVWAYVQSINGGGSTIRQICMHPNNPVLGYAVNYCQVLFDKTSTTRQMNNVDLELGVSTLADSGGNFYNYREYSRFEGMIATVDYDSKTYGMYHLLTGNSMFTYLGEAYCLLEMDGEHGASTVFVGDADGGSVFGGGTTNSEWDWQQYNFDNRDMQLIAETNVYDAACGGGYVKDYQYNTCIMRYHDANQFMPYRTEGAKPTTLFPSYYYTHNRLWDSSDSDLLKVVQSDTFYWQMTSRPGVTWDPLLTNSSRFYRRLGELDYQDNELFFTYSTDGSAQVYLCRAVFEGFLGSSGSVATFQFNSAVDVVSVTNMSAEELYVPTGTTLSFTFSDDNVTFYKWGGTSWDISSGASDGTDWATTLAALQSSAFPVNTVPTVYVRVSMTTTDTEVTPRIFNLELEVGAVSTGRGHLADSSEVSIVFEGATRTVFTSLMQSNVLLEAQVSIVAPKYNEGLDDFYK
jgi:hypothetical protein